MGWLPASAAAVLAAVSLTGAAQDLRDASPSQVPGSPAADEQQPSADRSAEALYAWPTTVDRAGRILVAVEVNGGGPFRFVLDTGANHSAVSQALADALGLTPEPEQSVRVHGMTGVADLPTVGVDEIAVGEISMRNLRLPVLTEAVLSGAHGILNVADLGKPRIEVDFRNGTVAVLESDRRPRPPGYLKVPVRLRHRGLLSAWVRVGHVRALAIFDTGAERSIGNEALLRALMSGPLRESGRPAATVIGVTPQLGLGEVMRSPPVQLGGTRLENLDILFGDLYVFKVWKLERQPALVIGMDALGTVEQLVVDYQRREILLKP